MASGACKEEKGDRERAESCRSILFPARITGTCAALGE